MGFRLSRSIYRGATRATLMKTLLVRLIPFSVRRLPRNPVITRGSSLRTCSGPSLTGIKPSRYIYRGTGAASTPNHVLSLSEATGATLLGLSLVRLVPFSVGRLLGNPVITRLSSLRICSSPILRALSLAAIFIEARKLPLPRILF